jgi:hypothetical protein
MDGHGWVPDCRGASLQFYRLRRAQRHRTQQPGGLSVHGLGGKQGAPLVGGQAGIANQPIVNA